MKETLKMIRFDYAIVRNMGAKYVLIFAVVCSVLSFIGITPAALGFLLFPLALFSPMQTVRKGDFMKIYGLLPIRREYPIRALFAEIVFPQLIGGILCEILLLLGQAIGESHILPAFLQENLYDKFKITVEETISCSDLYALSAIAAALITIIVLFFYMILEVKGETFAIMCCIPFLLLIGTAGVLYAVLFNSASYNVPTLGSMLPKTTVTRLLTILVSFASIAAAGFFLCEFTVKKTARKEI